jgi:hypothetical protein
VTEFMYLGIIPMNACFYGVHPDVWNVKDKLGCSWTTPVWLSSELCIFTELSGWHVFACSLQAILGAAHKLHEGSMLFYTCIGGI